MAISFPLDFPTETGISDIVFHMDNARAISRSPFTGRQQVYKWPLQKWSVDITLPTMQRDRAEAWIVFLAKLNSGVSTDLPTFYLSDPNAQPLGSQATNFLVNSGGDPNTVNLSDLDTGKVGALLPGDYIRIGTGSSSRLHKVLDQVDSNGVGEGSAAIWPANYQSLNDTEGSNLDAYGVFLLTDNRSSFSINNNSSYGITFTAESLV